MNGSGTVGVAVVGAGTISNQYLANLTSFPDLEVQIVADMFEEKAAEQAEKYGVPNSGGLQDALQSPEVEIIVNLTVPAAHADVSMAALDAGKHVWTEKPFALDRASGQALLAKAAATGLRIGGTPDTFLGAGLQTARRMIERGDIGVPLTGLTLLELPGVPQPPQTRRRGCAHHLARTSASPSPALQRRPRDSRVRRSQPPRSQSPRRSSDPAPT